MTPAGPSGILPEQVAGEKLLLRVCVDVLRVVSGFAARPGRPRHHGMAERAGGDCYAGAALKWPQKKRSGVPVSTLHADEEGRDRRVALSPDRGGCPRCPPISQQGPPATAHPGDAINACFQRYPASFLLSLRV